MHIEHLQSDGSQTRQKLYEITKNMHAHNRINLIDVLLNSLDMNVYVTVHSSN